MSSRPESLMEVTERTSGGIIIVALRGQIDGSSEKELGELLNAVDLVNVSGIILDCREVSLLDSAGMAALIRFLRKARPVCGVLFGLKKADKRRWDTAKLNGVWPIVTDLEEAKLFFTQHTPT